MRTRTGMREPTCSWLASGAGGGRASRAAPPTYSSTHKLTRRFLLSPPHTATRLLRQDAGLPATASTGAGTALGSYYLLASTPLMPMGGGSALPATAAGLAG